MLTRAEEPVGQGASLWLGQAERPNHRQWQRRLTEQTSESERGTIATEASENMVSHTGA